MIHHFILKDKLPVLEVDVIAWAKWYDRADRTVARTCGGGVTISTVFLGLDHAFLKSDKPLLFETMIFGGVHNNWQSRCSTWEEAEAEHSRVCRALEDGREP